MENLTRKIDEALRRLESLEIMVKSQGAGVVPEEAGADVAGDEASHPFSIFMKEQLDPITQRVQKIGGDVIKSWELFLKASDAHVATVIMSSKSKKPADSALPGILKPLSDAISAVRDFRDKNRGSKQFFHLSILYEIVPAFGWVAAAPTPAPHIHMMLEAGDFYMNKILREFRGKDENQVSWVKDLKLFLSELEKYVKKTYTTGMTWNPRGGEATAPSASSAPPPPSAPPAPAPPPPMPAGAPAPAGGRTGMTDVFGEINKGGDVTSGLKRVTDDMKTKNRPASERTGKVEVVPKKKQAAPAKKFGAASKTMPPKFGLEGKKWVVEFQKNNENIVIEADQVNPKQTAYIYKCENSVINIKGKINHVTMDACKKTGVVFSDLVSGADVVNCSSCKIQAVGIVPSVTIEKTNGATIYIGEKSMGLDIVTSTSSEVNVSYEYEGEYKESAIAEQFVTKIVKGEVETKQVEYV